MKRKETSLIALILILTMLTLVMPFSITFVKAPSDPKIVYVVICVDTEMWDAHAAIGTSDPHPIMDMRHYARSPPSTLSQVFDSDFRSSHLDSFGNNFKMTWFAEMDYLFAQGIFVYENGSSAGVSGYTAVHDILMNNWGAEIQMYGDSIEYHHHFIIYDGTWEGYDNGPDEGYPDYHMYALDHMIIDRNFYPSTWRSGWLIMPPVLSEWLEQWIPFDYTRDSGIWYPMHPSSGMDRWQTRSSELPFQDGVNEAFERARDEGSAIYSFYCHARDDMAWMIDSLQDYLDTADADEATYPNVSFEYVSAREAMQRALGFTDFTPPTLTVTTSGDTYTITSNEPLWANHPYVALKYTDGTYMHIEATPTETNTWIVTPPMDTPLETIGVAASDLYGNPGVACLRWRIFADGFETGNFDAWTGTAGSPTVQDTTKHHGTYAMQADTASTEQAFKDLGEHSTLYARVYVRFAGLPSSGNFIDFLELYDFSGNSDNDLVVGVYNDVETVKWCLRRLPWGTPPEKLATGPISTDTWYCVELKASLLWTTLSSEIWIDGVSKITDNFDSGSSSLIGRLYVGGWDKTDAITNYIDCVVASGDYVGPEPSVSISPASVNITVGESQMFTSNVSGGTPPYSYQWYLNGSEVSGATGSAWTFTPTSTGTYTIYLRVADNYTATAQSNTATARVETSMIVAISPTYVKMYFGQSQTFSCSVSGGTPPYSYQWYLNDTAVPSATSSTWTFTPRATGNYKVYLLVTDDHSIQALSNVVEDVCVYSVHLFLTVEPNQATYVRGQSVTLTVNVFNQFNPALESSLTLTVTGPNNYYDFDLQPISVPADTVREYSFSWVVPDVCGTYVVEVELVPPMLTAYDTVWLEAA